MIVSTIAVLIDPARMAEADAVLMMMYGSLSALVGAYFGFSGGAAKKQETQHDWTNLIQRDWTGYVVAGQQSAVKTSRNGNQKKAVNQ